MDEALLAEHLDAIHAVPRDDFVAERDRRVRELRKAGHREEATALKAQRKPTVPAWTVNQLARHHAEAIDELVEAGGQLRTAQLRATSGKGADGLRQATRRVRELAGDLARAAEDLLADAGASPTHLDEVQQTLFAAAIDPDLQDTLCRGTFSRPVEAAGFGVMTGLAAVPDEAREDDVTPGPSQAQGEEAAQEELEAQEREQRREREEEAAVREARRRALERQRADLQRSMVRQQRRVEQARSRADDLQARADEAAVEAREQEETNASIANELEDVERELAELTEAGADVGAR